MPKQSDIPCAMVYGLMARSAGLVSLRRPTGSLLQDLTPASGCQDHASLPSASPALVWRSQSVHRIPHPMSVTIAIRPDGCGTARNILPGLLLIKRIIFVGRLTEIRKISPSGKSPRLKRDELCFDRFQRAPCSSPPQPGPAVAHQHWCRRCGLHTRAEGSIETDRRCVAALPP